MVPCPSVGAAVLGGFGVLVVGGQGLVVVGLAVVLGLVAEVSQALVWTS